MEQELILVIDFGGQYNQLIARRVRELSVYSEMIPYDTPLAVIKEKRPRGLIFSGGPASIHLHGAPVCDPGIFELGIPILGICYGMQLMAFQLGGEVSPARIREYGRTFLEVKSGDLLFDGLARKMQVWMSHGDAIAKVPDGFVVTAATTDCPVAAMSNPSRRLFGVQFHPEVKHTPFGDEILKNFLFKVCGCRGTWSLAGFVEQTVENIRNRVGDRKVLCALSGGVDSSVAAVLVDKAVGQNLTCIFVNHGLLRKGEPEQVIRTFRDEKKMNLVYVDAGQRFLDRLRSVTDPEAKRKIIGHEFIRVFEEEARRLGDIGFLVQGTLYPDVIESGTRTAATIKTHHNVGGLPDDMQFELIEPLRLLFKDEVREIGTRLGLPAEIVWRQPFPGPGLGVRVLEEVTPEKVEILRAADAIVTEEIKRAGLDRDIWQYFAVLPPVRSVGVMGDERTYAYPIIVRAVVSDDAMTADWARLPYEVLDTISRRIVNEVRHVNRVAYDITSKPPGTIEWE